MHARYEPRLGCYDGDYSSRNHKDKGNSSGPEMNSPRNNKEILEFRGELELEKKENSL